MKLFVLLLLFIPYISFGFYKSKPPSDRWADDEELFDECQIQLKNSLLVLSYLSQRNYVLAQQMLDFLSQDSKKAESFLEEYNENYTPKPPPPEISQEPFMQNIGSMIWRYPSAKALDDIRTLQTLSLMQLISPKKLEALIFSAFFHEALKLLTKGLDLLNDLAEKSVHEPAIQLKDQFENFVIKYLNELRVPDYHLSDSSLRNNWRSGKCKKALAKSFVPRN